MSMKTVTFEATEESIATIDEIAVNLGIDRAEVLREALAQYLADDDGLQAELAEAVRQADAGETISHEEVMAEFESWTSSVKGRQAA